jgi:hypothetical protein
MLALHVAKRYGPQPDVILATDDSPLVHLHRPDALAGSPTERGYAEAMAALGSPRRGRLLPPNSLGFTSRSLLDGQRPIGQLHRAAALFAGALWEWNIIAWEAGG